MAKAIYDSAYTDRKIPAAQKITEIVCENRALQVEATLGPKFWSLPDWKGYFHMQLKEAHKLLKTFEPEVVMMAVRQTSAASLRLGRFIAACKRLQKEVEFSRENKVEPTKGPLNSTGQFKRKNNLPEDL